MVNLLPQVNSLETPQLKVPKRDEAAAGAGTERA